MLIAHQRDIVLDVNSTSETDCYIVVIKKSCISLRFQILEKLELES